MRLRSSGVSGLCVRIGQRGGVTLLVHHGVETFPAMYGLLNSENTMHIGRFHLGNISVHITTRAKFCPVRLGE